MEDYPPPVDATSNWYEQLKTNRKWISFFGGSLADKTGFESLAGVYLGAPEYNLTDIVNCIRGDTESTQRLWPEIMTYDLRRDAPRFALPVFFFVGRHDYTTPWELTEQYFNFLQAPQKKLYWFERSAHCPNFEEPQEFARAVRESFRQHGADR